MSISSPSLIGREKEIGQLMNYLDQSINGNGQTVFIAGEAGVGKTSLVKEFLHKVQEKGVRVLKSWCLSGAAVPYFPFIEAFNAYIENPIDEASQETLSNQLGITGWLRGPINKPESEKAGIGITGWLRGPRKEEKREEKKEIPIVGSDKTFEAVLNVLLQFSERQPHLLFIDDLQWADHLSISLLYYLTKKCRDSKLLILGTYRPEDIVPMKGELFHPLQDTLLSMSREGLLNKVDLGRLSEGDIPLLVKAMYDTSFSDEFVNRLYEETDGNPLFAIETLNLLKEEGYISKENEHWVLKASPEQIGIPSKVQDVIDRRLLRVERTERRLLDLASVYGQSFDPEILCDALKTNLIDVYEGLTEIEEKHKLIHSAGESFKFSHHKIREVLYDNLHFGLRKVYHLQLAESLEKELDEPVPNGIMTEVAYHYVTGGASDRAFKYLMQLGEKALRMNAYIDAIRYLNQAKEATEKKSTLATNENLMLIYWRRGSAWGQYEEDSGASEKSLDDYNLSLEYAKRSKDELSIARAHRRISVAYNIHVIAYEEVEIKLSHLREALKIAKKIKNKQIEGIALQDIGYTYLITDPKKRDLGLKYIEDSLICFKAVNFQNGFAVTYGRIGYYYRMIGEHDKALDYYTKAESIYRDLGISTEVTLFYLSIIYASLGQYSKAISAANTGLEQARKNSMILTTTWILNTIGWIYFHLSNIELALEYNNEALKLLREYHKKMGLGGVPYTLSNLGAIYLSINDYEKAEQYFRETEETKELHGGNRLYSRFLIGFGEIALHNGDNAKALEYAEESMEIADYNRSKKYRTTSLLFKGKVLAKMDKLDEAIEIMKNALILAQTMNFPYWMWQIHYNLGLVYEENGQNELATQHYQKSLNLIEETAEKIDDETLQSSLLNTKIRKTILDSKLIPV